MNNIIDQIKTLIVSEYHKFYEANGYVDREFFEGEALKNICNSALIAIFPSILPLNNCQCLYP
jgi:hypothetical protein